MRGDIVQHRFTTRKDPRTGVPVKQLTSQPGNHHHLYFTSNSFTRDQQAIIFLSENSEESPNLYRLSLENGEAVQLSDNIDGYLRSYVYYDGDPYRGLGKASVSYNPETNSVLYIQGQKVLKVNVLTLTEEVIFTLPDHVMTGFTHVSPDGRYACIPYIAEEAFNVGDRNHFALIRQKVEAEQIRSHVLVIDLLTGTGEIWFSQVGWITHVQFHPGDHRQILYNHEGGMVDQRIWLYRNGRIEKIRDQSQEREQIWICHEMWSRGGDSIIYHGTKGVPNDPSITGNTEARLTSPSFVGLMKLHQHDSGFIELEFPPEMTSYGHFTTSSTEDRLVTDGIIDQASIHICHIDWKHRQLSWQRLCTHGSSFMVQDVHPHPIFSYDDRSILFTSDAHNQVKKGNIYLVEKE
jgi:oligogalacturonide lyase